MTTRKLLERGTTAALVAVALSIALGQPPPKEPPEPGFTMPAGILSDPNHDYVSPYVVTCPPPTKTSAATNPTSSDC
jgi:hypothetical protein